MSNQFWEFFIIRDENYGKQIRAGSERVRVKNFPATPTLVTYMHSHLMDFEDGESNTSSEVNEDHLNFNPNMNGTNQPRWEIKKSFIITEVF